MYIIPSSWQTSVRSGSRHGLLKATLLYNGSNAFTAQAARLSTEHAHSDQDQQKNIYGEGGLQHDQPSSDHPSTDQSPAVTSTVTIHASRLSPQIHRNTYTDTSSSGYIAPRISLSDSSRKHHDLQSFLQYSANEGLNTNAPTYKGTLYEYMTATALAEFGLDLTRTGRTNDLGIDLVGTWSLPTGEPVKVLIQCKASKTMPSMIRELEGAYVGAPAGWQDGTAIAFLVSTHASTTGVREALQRSQLPLGVAHVTAQGVIKSLWWNRVAAEACLGDLSVTTVYRPGGTSAATEGTLSLRYRGRPWRRSMP